MGPPDQPPAQTNCARRAVGAAVCLSPVVLLLASLAYSLLVERKGAAWLGVMAVGLLVGSLNAYLSFLRPLLYRWRHGSMEGWRFVSVLPGVGTFVVALAGALGFGAEWTALLGLFVLAIDTGGLPWFLVVTWRDRGLWDE